VLLPSTARLTPLSAWIVFDNHGKDLKMLDASTRARVASWPAASAGTIVLALLLSACATPAPPVTPPAPPQPPAPVRPSLDPYLDTLSRLAPGDPGRQAAELAGTLEAMQQSPTAQNTLRHALALGSAGHAGSNPVEARRLLADLLAGSPALAPEELALASAYLREFDARVALYAELARQREEAERKFESLDLSAGRRTHALEAENARLERALAEANRKLEAVAEMERSLLDLVGEPDSGEPPPQPQQ
jgi:hypothetical protein